MKIETKFEIGDLVTAKNYIGAYVIQGIIILSSGVHYILDGGFDSCYVDDLSQIIDGRYVLEEDLTEVVKTS